MGGERRLILKHLTRGRLILGRLACAAGILAASSTVASSAGAAEACGAAVPFPDGVVAFKAVRVYTAANGESAFEDVTYKGASKAYFKPGELFSHVNFGPASKVQLVSGPANVKLAPHPSPYTEVFMTLQGESAVILPSGATLKLTPGVMVIMDDMGSKTGHGGSTGPCGYVALNIVPPPASDRVP